MNNLLQTVKGWFVVEEKNAGGEVAEGEHQMYCDEYREAALKELEKRYGEAIDYYCGICKRGWETKQGARMHKRLKHEGGKSNLPQLTSPQ